MQILLLQAEPGQKSDQQLGPEWKEKCMKLSGMKEKAHAGI